MYYMFVRKKLFYMFQFRKEMFNRCTGRNPLVKANFFIILLFIIRFDCVCLSNISQLFIFLEYDLSPECH